MIIAKRKVEEQRWFHLALTRDAASELRLYLNGELDQTSRRATPERFTALDVGRTIQSPGTAAELTQLRVWNVARSAAQIGANFRRTIAANAPADGLVLVVPGHETRLSGQARIESVLDVPELQTAEEVRAEVARFDRFRTLASRGSDVARGREQFVANCIACHRVGGQGVSIGPVLDGVAGKGIEGLLRAILTPNAGVESGYRTLIVHTRDGELLSGFLADEDATSITLRRKDREDLHLPRAEIEHLRYDQLSLMPEGLLDALTEQEVSDLFAYLLSLR